MIPLLGGFWGQGIRWKGYFGPQRSTLASKVTERSNLSKMVHFKHFWPLGEKKIQTKDKFNGYNIILQALPVWKWYYNKNWTNSIQMVDHWKNSLVHNLPVPLCFSQNRWNYAYDLFAFKLLIWSDNRSVTFIWSGQHYS